MVKNPSPVLSNEFKPNSTINRSRPTKERLQPTRNPLLASELEIFYCRTIEDQMIQRFVAGESHAIAYIACTRGDTIRNSTHKFTMESEDLLVVKEHLERVTEGYATCQLKERWRWEVTCDLKPLDPMKLSAA